MIPQKLKKLMVPIIMTGLSFLLAILLYFFVTWQSANPYIWRGILFFIPCFCFGLITYLAYIEKISRLCSIILSLCLAVVSIVAASGLLVYLSIDAATTTTTEIKKYERVLRISGITEEFQPNIFPAEIPADAYDVNFSYHPAFMMGGEELMLEFKADADKINSYKKEFEANAAWIGNGPNTYAEDYGIFSGTLTSFNLPYDATIYVISATPSHKDDWNHGKRLLTAISISENYVLFYAEKW
ncbi:hypothetical protein [Oscillibacter sp.]|uniref:hypothetical protein n=1 Tax=Oscillibacter sp. TaxID=1945593 RepID=UPI0028ACFC02|nr:hypothetical protein [Oscillibacter sp.]